MQQLMLLMPCVLTLLHYNCFNLTTEAINFTTCSSTSTQFLVVICSLNITKHSYTEDAPSKYFYNV